MENEEENIIIRDDEIKPQRSASLRPPEFIWSGNTSTISENWKFFKQKFDIYLKASKLNNEDSEYKISLLLSFVGDRALKVYNNFVYSHAEDKSDINVVIAKFDAYFLPECNITYERHNFFLRDQKEGEGIDTYVTELRDLSASCNFGQLTDSLIKDRIVLGIKDRAVKDRLLRTKDLDLNKTIDICKSSELCKVQLNDICATTAGLDIHKIKFKPEHNYKSNGNTQVGLSTGTTPNIRKTTRNVNKSNVRKSSDYKVCQKCGYNHPMFKCPAYGKKCNKCNRLNHFSNQCKTKPNLRNVNEVQVSPDEELFLGSINKISLVNDDSNENEWSVKLLTNNLTFISYKLDTGAQVNVLTKDYLKILDIDVNNLIESSVKLTAYTGQKLKVIGKCFIDIMHKEKSYKILFYVVESKASCILGLKSCIELNLVRKIDHVTKSSQWVKKSVNNYNRPMPNINECESISLANRPSENILLDYPKLFHGIGCLNEEHTIKLKPDAIPVVHATRKVPLALKSKLKSKLDELVSLKILEKVDKPTQWVNSLVIVTKPNGDLRLCIDPKNLNDAIVRPRFQMPTFEEITSKLSGAKVFSTLDASNGFWHIKLDEDSSDLCTFNTPFGRYKFLRLPYGICSASEVFQKRMSEIFENMEGVEVYVDDVIIWGTNKSEHDKRLRSVLDKMNSENIRLNKAKCKIGISELNYLGHKIDKNGVHIDKSKQEAITTIEPPKDRKALEQFLGLITYVNKFVPNLSEHTAPLRALLKKNVEFIWSHEQQVKFDLLKKMLVCSPVLQFFDISKPIVLSVDSSSYALGAVLLQNGLPVVYASKALNSVQQLYSQIEKEMLAVLFGCERFSQYVYGLHFTIETDHRPLVSIIKKNIDLCPPRLQRMLLRLQRYSFDLVYKKGQELYIADALSRISSESINTCSVDSQTQNVEAHVCAIVENINVTPNQLSNIINLSENDHELRTLKKFISSKWPSHKNELPDVIKNYWKVKDELSLCKNLILKGNALVIPSSLRHEMLKRLHFTHCGINKTLLRAKNVIYWPNIESQIKDMISHCEPCITFQNECKKEPLLPHPVPELPWEKIGLDIFQLNGKNYLLITDYYSKYPEMVYLSNLTCSNIINHVKQIFSRHGIPSMAISDSGTQFTAKEFQNFANEWGFKIAFSSPYHHQSNGMVERAIQTLKRTLKKSFMDKKDPYLVMLEFRNTPLGDGLPSPAEILFNRKLRGILPIQTKELKPKIPVNVYNNLTKRQNLHKHYYDRKTKPLRELRKNELVIFKLNDTWVRAFVLNYGKVPRSYLIQTENGKIYQRNRIFLRPLGKMNDDTMYSSDVSENPESAVLIPTYQTPNNKQMYSNHKTNSPSHVNSSHKNATPLGEKQNPLKSPIGDNYQTRFGRFVKPRKRLDL